jgi:hypothetical protein
LLLNVALFRFGTADFLAISQKVTGQKRAASQAKNKPQSECRAIDLDQGKRFSSGNILRAFA